MSVLQYPDAITAPDLQVWNNAAFDNEESEGSSAAVRASWSDLLQPLLPNRCSSESIQSDYCKENLGPAVLMTPACGKSSVPFKPVDTNTNLEPVSAVKKGFEEVEERVEKIRDEGKIDAEIEAIEKEISRLNSRLEALKIEKAERNEKAVEKRGRVVAAKFMEPKQSVKNLDGFKKIESSMFSAKGTKIDRRGMSLGPSEIIAATGFRRPSKLEITPVHGTQSRRKSCFWKLQDIDELRATKERGKSLSLSPKSRKTVSKVQAPKQAATTVGGSKRPVKKEDKVLASIEPKKLFKDGGEKSVAAKKTPFKAGRVVPSRYNQIGNSAVSDGRKRSWPEDDKDDSKRCDKKRVSLVGKPRGVGRETSRSQGPESRVKKRWEIPSEIVVYQGAMEDDKSPCGVAEMGDVLPKIRTVRCGNDTPRGSGPAKRVAELVGMKSYFSTTEEFCQELSFAEEND